MVQAPIWKDTYYRYTGEYLIRVDSESGETIFNGKSYSTPDGETARINVSDICADYLSAELGDMPQDGINLYDFNLPNKKRVFYLYKKIKIEGVETEVLGETYTFTYDWSYGQQSGDIINRHAYGQIFFINSDNYVSMDVYGVDSTTTCGKYVLCYLATDGNWRSMVMEGEFKIYDDFNSYETKSSYNNTNTSFSRKKYINQITRKYELNTGWLNDEQSEMFAATLVPSASVYLQDIEKNTIIPVVIVENDVEHKRYINEKKLISYRIVVEESQNKEIR